MNYSLRMAKVDDGRSKRGGAEGPKVRSKGVADGELVNIPVLRQVV